MNTKDEISPITDPLKDAIDIYMDYSTEHKELLDSYKKIVGKLDTKTKKIIGYLSDVVAEMDEKIQEAFEQLESINNNYDPDNLTQSLREISDFAKTKIKGLTHLESKYKTTKLLLSARLLGDKYEN